MNNRYHWIAAITVILALFGLLAITSASQIIAYAKYKDSLYFFKRQLVYVIAGGFLFWLFSRIDYMKLRRLTMPFAVGCIALLVMVFIPSIGYSAGGASRWIPLGFFNLQPSEFAKLASVLVTVFLVNRQKQGFKDLNSLIPFSIILVMAALVMAQPDMGTTILIVGVSFIMLFIGGLSWSLVSGISATGILLAGLLIKMEPYRFKRLLSFIDPLDDPRGGGLQIIQGAIAMGSGGFWGSGLAMSKQKFFFLPAAHTDFIMAIIGEELGLLGIVGLVVLFALLAVCGFSIAYNTRDSYGRLLATGLTVMIVMQAMVNMGAVSGIMPITGVPLPMISFGGSSLLTTMIALGIIASIAKREA